MSELVRDTAEKIMSYLRDRSGLIPEVDDEVEREIIDEISTTIEATLKENSKQGLEQIDEILAVLKPLVDMNFKSGYDIVDVDEYGHPLSAEGVARGNARKVILKYIK